MGFILFCRRDNATEILQYIFIESKNGFLCFFSQLTAWFLEDTRIEKRTIDRARDEEKKTDSKWKEIERKWKKSET